jgi:hypothetical protein
MRSVTGVPASCSAQCREEGWCCVDDMLEMHRDAARNMDDLFGSGF